MSFIVLTSGISVAYYNTYSKIYEDEPIIVSISEGEYSFLDFKISDSDIKKMKKKKKKAFPKSSINM